MGSAQLQLKYGVYDTLTQTATAAFSYANPPSFSHYYKRAFYSLLIDFCLRAFHKDSLQHPKLILKWARYVMKEPLTF